MEQEGYESDEFLDDTLDLTTDSVPQENTVAEDSDTLQSYQERVKETLKSYLKC